MNELTIKAVVENLDTVTDFINEQLEALDCPMKTQMQIDIAIDEIFSNIAHYAYPGGEGNATIQIDSSENSSVSIVFIDSGIKYNPLAKEDPDVTLSAEDRNIGGLGIFMVKKSMDDMFYEYRDGQNILTLVKNI